MSVKSTIPVLAKFATDNEFRTGSGNNAYNLGKLANAKKVLALTVDSTLIVQDKPGFFTRLKEYLFGSTVNRNLDLIVSHVIREFGKANLNDLRSTSYEDLKAARIAIEVLQTQASGFAIMDFITILRQIDNHLPIANRSEVRSYDAQTFTNSRDTIFQMGHRNYPPRLRLPQDEKLLLQMQ